MIAWRIEHLDQSSLFFSNFTRRSVGHRSPCNPERERTTRRVAEAILLRDGNSPAVQAGNITIKTAQRGNQVTNSAPQARTTLWVSITRCPDVPGTTRFVWFACPESLTQYVYSGRFRGKLVRPPTLSAARSVEIVSEEYWPGPGHMTSRAVTGDLIALT